MLVQGRNLQRDQPGMRGFTTPSRRTHPPRLSPARGWWSPAVPQAAGVPQREERAQAPWSQGVGRGWLGLLRGVPSCCRSAPRAWWMKTRSNSFTPSSSLKEVSLRPGPQFLQSSRFPVAALRRVGVPFMGRGPSPTHTLPSIPCPVLPLSGRRRGGLQPRTEQQYTESAWGRGSGGPTLPALPLVSPDSTTYAHFLFNAFDADGNGAIRFEVGPCRPLPRPLVLHLPATVPPPQGRQRLRRDPGVNGPVCHPGNEWTLLGWPWA